MGKYLFKVSKITNVSKMTLEQRYKERCSTVFLMTLSRYLFGKFILAKEKITQP